MKNIRVRFAPSPTGLLHLGGIRTAIYNYVFAKKHKGKFILRIEDTDKNRFLSGTEQYIREALEWCGLNIDESFFNKGKYGPYIQSYRKHIYFFYIQKLLEKDYAYYDFDSSKKDNIDNSRFKKKKSFIKKLELPYVIRFKIPKNKLIFISDKIRGKIKINSSSLDDKIIVKSDGMVTYHLANVIDDHLMKITHVIRGEEWLPSMPLHLLIYKAFEWQMPLFAHLPLILKTSGSGKLSKRDTGTNIFPIEWKNIKTINSGYREEGYFPEAIVNMLFFLGCQPRKENNSLFIKKLEKQFSLKKINKSGSIFNKEKTFWFNKQFFLKKTLEHLLILYRKEFNTYGIYTTDKKLIKVINLIKTRISILQDLWKNAYYFFISPQIYDEKYITINKIFINLHKSFIKIKYFNSFTLKKIIKSFINDYHLSLKQVIQSLRIALVGSLKGVDIFLIMEIIGKKETIERIKKYY